MFCTSCGVKNAVDSNFCKQCGGKLVGSAPKITQEAFERALPDEEQTAALLERAYRLRRSGDVDAAITLCLEALRLRADSTASHSLLGQLYEEKGDTQAAIHEYERVLALNPGSIADRVQLDELRAREASGETGPRVAGQAGDATRTLPRVRLGDHRSAPVFDASRFTSAGVALVLLVLGGLVALQLRPHTAAAPDTTAPMSRAPLVKSPRPDTTPQTAPTTLTTPTTPIVADAQTPGATQATAATMPTSGKNAALPLAGGVTGAAQTATSLPATPTAPTVIVQRAPAEIRYINVPGQTAPLNVTGVTTGPRLPGRNVRANRSAPNTTDTNRVILDPDVMDNNGKITVRVNDNDMSGKSGDGGSRTGEGTGDKTAPRAPDRVRDSGGDAPAMSAHLELEKPTHGASRSAAGSSSSEARSFVAMGEDKKRQKEYRGAIEAFTRALGSAGDQSGYIYQQRALCYQYLTDASSARADYSRAIEEYRKLEARDPETARNGIRACQSGIKTCGE